MRRLAPVGFEPSFKVTDVAGLHIDGLLGHPAESRVPGVFEGNPGHIQRALMVRDHLADPDVTGVDPGNRRHASLHPSFEGPSGNVGLSKWLTRCATGEFPCISSP